MMHNRIDMDISLARGSSALLVAGGSGSKSLNHQRNREAAREHGLSDITLQGVELQLLIGSLSE
jgi:hypothetical protein